MLNQVCNFDAEPIPHQEQIIAKLGNSKFYSKTDFTKGFWQIPIKPQDRHKTAFATEEGLKQFVVMPFGLVLASNFYCRMVRKLLMGMENAESYVDDVILHNDSWEHHLHTIEEFLKRVKDANLTLRPSKCTFGAQKIDFLGHTLGQGLLEPQANKIQHIMNIQKPRDKKELRSYLGCIKYHRKFIENFAENAVVLTDMLAKRQPNKLRWSEQASAAFEYFRLKLSEYPILRLFDSNREVYVATDSSDFTLGGTMFQEYDGVLYPVKYLSRKLKPAETRYSTIERECLAIVWAIKQLHSYVYGRTLTLMSDHQPLSYLNSSKYSNCRIMG